MQKPALANTKTKPQFGTPFTTYGQEMEQALYSYNPGAHTGQMWTPTREQKWDT